MMNNAEVIIRAVLDCGADDLRILNGVEYDLYDIVDDMRADGENISLNSILRRIFLKGIEEIAQAVQVRISEKGNSCSKEMESLMKLNPYKDIQFDSNCLGSYILFVQYGDIYREYLGNAVESAEDNMGFSFTG